MTFKNEISVQASSPDALKRDVALILTNAATQIQDLVQYSTVPVGTSYGDVMRHASDIQRVLKILYRESDIYFRVVSPTFEVDVTPNHK
jgi:hypothetical protein